MLLTAIAAPERDGLSAMPYTGINAPAAGKQISVKMPAVPLSQIRFTKGLNRRILSLKQGLSDRIGAFFLLIYRVMPSQEVQYKNSYSPLTKGGNFENYLLLECQLRCSLVPRTDFA